MIKAADIYNATHDGLDIILYYYPQAEGCIDNKKKFKRRPDEDDASACLKKYDDCYKVTDFGDSGTAMSPIDICMNEENVRFPEAVALLASRYNVTDELKRSVNKPDIRKRPATADEAEGARFFELEEKFTDVQLQVLGPRVRQEHVDALHWYVAKSISYVRNREVTTKYTTPTYPIFMRECAVTKKDGSTDKFYKVYEPLNPDKQWRFSYTPDGVKPKQYINGFAELQKAYRDFNAQEEKLFFNDPKNKDAQYKEQKLKEAFICSGERDALCIRALGCHPLWFNSETYKVTPEEIKEIYKYVERIYNIPDIDDTGVRKGTELALRFLDIYTIWLPGWLRGYRDQRGKPRKDFRDFVDLRPKQEDFRNLQTLAMPARFWVDSWSERSRKTIYEVNSAYLHYFLTLNGFYTLKDDNSKDARYIHRNGCIVSEIKAKDIVAFLKRFTIERYLPVDIRNLILNSPRTGESSLAQLDEINLDFRSYTPKEQYMFFRGETWEVSKDGIKSLHGQIPDNRSAWESNVIPHKVSILPPMFEWSHRKDSEDRDVFDITVKEHKSCFFNYLINTSRLYWRNELEYAWKDKGVDEADKYRAEHKFDIAGPLLSRDEIREQKQNLLNKMFAIGYNMHRYKSPSRAWALYAMDNKIGEDDECNGRSGKSFLFKTFRFFMRTVNLSGRNPRLLDNPHVFDQVDVHTDFVLVDDCDRYLPMSQFYDNITSGMTVNPKNNKSFFIEFEESPKFGFTTNYVPREFDPSTSARMLYMVFSDYYHQKTEENDYLESRTIRDDFDRNLMTNTDYGEEDWNWDLNFFAQCLQFYLAMVDRNVKIQPPMDNILKRKRKADMGSDFEDWAYCYFSEDGENLNTPLVREQVYDDFIVASKSKKDFWKMQRFTKALRSFSELCPYIAEMNPADLLNKSGRYLQKVDGKTKEMIYMRSRQTNGEPAAFVPQVESDDGNAPF